MELTRLYPGWVAGRVCSPQGAVQATHPAGLLWVLRGSVLHRGVLSDLFGTHYPSHRVRPVQVTWAVWSYSRGVRHLLQAAVGGHLGTSTGVWPSAGWFERELWEMLGVRAVGHPDLRRLLTDYGFVGRPLRRDFPVGGYSEVRFSERSKRVVLRPVRFTQEFRLFDFKSPWQA